MEKPRLWRKHLIQPISDAMSRKKWHNGDVSRIEMKSKTILITNRRNGLRDTI
ncbi:hypothetical protein LTSEGIV_3474 [Salmonella enterica subsp. enterica serovar Give str. S5-487]|nr:hypothetical protein LTSEGIV_3474 [Salmonella enterica subsp. enterica serovar Give str. S5-487]EHC64437.1 hypothetical protein LTSEMIN_3956 [Salmonella enterica subsp. enterica serovar Minnesota str. A4-603]